MNGSEDDMKLQIKKSKYLPLFFIIVCMLFLTACTKEPISYNYDFVNITYQDDTYVLLEYNQDIFYYDRNADAYLEEDMIHELPHEKWDFVYYNGDVFVRDSMAEEANAYYKNDANYTWSIEVDSEDMEEVTIYPLSISAEDLAVIYNFENAEKKDTLAFEDIEIFGTLKKTSADGFIYGSTSLAYYEGAWYWRSEIIDESTEGWPEYVYKLPDSLNTQITTQMN